MRANERKEMKTIGLLGGMSWESTELYYRHINQEIRRQLKGLHSAKIVLVSVDFHEIEVLQPFWWDSLYYLLFGVFKAYHPQRYVYLKGEGIVSVDGVVAIDIHIVFYFLKTFGNFYATKGWIF